MSYTYYEGNLQNFDESQWILAAQRGDPEVFNELVLTYQNAVYNLAYRIIGDDDLAEDITQNTFIAAYRGLPGFRNGSFRSWLYRITTNLCYDELRRFKRHPVLSIDAEERTEENFRPLYDWSSSHNSLEHLYTQHELEQTIQQALNSLDPDQRAAVVLVDLYELCYQEAMKVLHIPLGTLKSRLARGRARLRQLLNHQDCDEV